MRKIGEQQRRRFARRQQCVAHGKGCRR
jgi:hypothetical protein